METKTISLPKLNRLTPTLESTALKLMEEAGELAQAIGKLRGMSGEKVEYSENETTNTIMSELLDVAQTAVSMMFVMEEVYGVDIEGSLEKHIDKLHKKGYLGT
ncbi:MAG: MazG-like family protein [Candidatus Saccharibacteria bacterium]